MYAIPVSLEMLFFNLQLYRRQNTPYHQSSSSITFNIALEKNSTQIMARQNSVVFLNFIKILIF
jgi:hypothetical protein